MDITNTTNTTTATAAPASNSFTIREMQDSDWPLVQAGFAHSFWDSHPPSVWDWRYQRHLHSAPRQGWRAWLAQAHERGEVIAWQAASVHQGWREGHACTIVLPRDNFTHPHWRSGGKRSPYVQVETAFHQHQIGYATLGLGFGLDRRLKLAFLAGNAIPFSTGQWMQATVEPDMRHQGHSVQLSLTEFEEPEWDALWQQRRTQVAWSMVRDQAFLHWRFHARQGKVYHRIAIRSATSRVPLGYIVLQHRSPTETLWVDGVLPPHPEQLRDTWGLLGRWLHRQGLQRFLTYTTPGCPEYALFQGFGWQTCAAPLPVLSGFRLYESGLSNQDVLQHYAATLADSDLF
ncbi:MAG: hypothetical protein RLZZ612_600 [Pseudomonadota bacterium]|jgi:hypothetical protein